MTTTFLVIGAVGVVLVLVGVLIGDFGGPDVDGPFSVPAIAAFLGGGGFGGAIASATLGEALPTGIDILLSAAIGLVVALPLAWMALRLTARLMHMRTDPTIVSTDVIGALGRVVTSIGATGFGEVRVSVGGHQLKFNARSDTPLTIGTPVYVVDTLSETSVEVVSTVAKDPVALPPPTPREMRPADVDPT